MAGLFYAAAYTTITPGTGSGQELNGITGVIIGGTSIAGGSGSLIGPLNGVYKQAELKNRLCGRQTDGAETIALRLRNAEQEDACLPQYQYCLVSSDRETDYASFCALLKCQSMRARLMR